MVKLYKNQTLSDCGPIAALNALRFHGRKLNPRSSAMRKIKELGAYTPRYGMTCMQLHHVLTEIGFYVHFSTNDSIKDIEQYLNQGYSFILNYYHRITCIGHYVYVVRHTKNYFIIANELITKHATGRKAKKFYKNKVMWLTVFVLVNYKPKLI